MDIHLETKVYITVDSKQMVELAYQCYSPRTKWSEVKNWKVEDVFRLFSQAVERHPEIISELSVFELYPHFTTGISPFIDGPSPEEQGKAIQESLDKFKEDED